MRLRNVIRLACGLLVVIGVPAAAHAQRPNSREVEVLALQLAAAVSTADVPEQAAFPGLSDLPNVNSRFHTDVSGALRYQPPAADWLAYGANLQSSVRRYETADEFMVLGHAAGVNASVRAGRRLTFGASGSASYLPSYGLNMTPVGDPFALAGGTQPTGLLPSSTVDYSLAKRTMVSLNTGGSLQYSLSRRLSVSGVYSRAQQAFRREGDPDLHQQSAAARLSYRLNRFVGLRLGFQRRYADFISGGAVETTVVDDVDVGLDSAYGREVSLTRSTTLSFETGSVLTNRNGDQGANVTGRATLAQRLGRDGLASLGFYRGVELREGFDQPLFSNSVNGEVRFDFTSNVGVAVSGAGSVGSTFGDATGSGDTVDNQVRSYQASARVFYRFMRRGQVYGQYLFSGHDVGSAVGLLDGVTRTSAIRSLRAGVSWSVGLASQRRPAGSSSASASAGR